MKFKIFLLIVSVLFEITPRVELLDLFSPKSACGCDEWEPGVRDCRDGLERVLKKFPQRTYDYGQTILASFNTQVDNLKKLTNSTSATLSSKSIKILKALSLLSKVDSTPSNLLYQLRKALPEKTQAYYNIVTSLMKTIGRLAQPINDVIRDVENSLLTCLKQFDKRFTVRKQDRTEKIDFKAMVNSARNNTKTVAFIAETATNNANVADESFEAIAIVTLISNLQVVAVHGTNANMGSVLVSETTNISPFLPLCFEALDPLVNDITKLISSASFDGVDNIKEYLRTYVQIIHSYNDQWAELLGPYEGVNITTDEVNENLATNQNGGVKPTEAKENLNSTSSQPSH